MRRGRPLIDVLAEHFEPPRPRIYGVAHPSHAQCTVCTVCGESNRHEDMGVFFHCDDGTDAGVMGCTRPRRPATEKRRP